MTDHKEADLTLLPLYRQPPHAVSYTHLDVYKRQEQQRLAEEHLQEAADIGRISGISLEKLIELLTIFYQEED